MGGAVILGLVAGIKNSINSYWLDGLILIFAAALLTYLSLNFYKMVHTMEAHTRKMKKKLQGTLEVSAQAQKSGEVAFAKQHAFFVFSAVTGFREGMETIIFLFAVVPDLDHPELKLPLSIVSALLVSRIIGCVLMYSTSNAPLKVFIKVISIVLMFMAAGFFSCSVHAFQELEFFGIWSPRSERPWQNQQVFDASDCCSDKTNYFFVLMRALIGWQDQPTPVEFFAWIIYWILAISVGVVMIQRAKSQMAKMFKKWAEEDAKELSGSAAEVNNEEAAPSDTANSVAVQEEPAAKTDESAAKAEEPAQRKEETSV